MPFFTYTDKELHYLSCRDPALKSIIDRYGRIERETNPDLFSALVDSIIGQQISTKAHMTIRGRIIELLGEITPQTINGCSEDKLQKTGITFKKAGYIKGISAAVASGSLDLLSLTAKSDDEIKKELTVLPGIGVWTAEMLMIFSMNRMNILSLKDLAIVRGLTRIYNLETINKDTRRC